MRRAVVGVLGGIAIVLGLALLFLPGPGLLLIAIGLMILSLEFPWAQRIVLRLRTWVRGKKSSREQQRESP